MDIYKLGFLISITLCVSCNFTTEKPITVDKKANTSCDSLEYHLYASFPDSFLLRKPSVELMNDTLKIQYLQKWEVQHNVLMEAIISRTYHLLESNNYLGNINGHEYSIMEIIIYSSSGDHLTSPVQLSLSSSQPLLNNEWMSRSYRNMNYYILNQVDPSNYWIYDDLLGMYYRETNDEDFNLTFFDVYMDITTNKVIHQFENRVLDSLVARCYRNSKTIDPAIIRQFRDYLRAIELENNGEFKIIDQKPDGYKESTK
ncbi:hypothetical protein G3O08_20200 [Cryomorpha ignava]|uniref:Uncharacterized protein n=1 Tax=Cryomorpha ignava TaxID=101383 RepID=A0A7K3WYQ2_9FLAO|nr:hypothetical protein [Cryomorpha ignava]NEN25815.1 hypothetical protein [Cryomorpha ignava]